MGLNRGDVLVGAIEGGGTKYVCAVGSGPGKNILARTSLPTGNDPAKLLTTVVDWFRHQEKLYGKLAAIGFASFGPVDLASDSTTYGYVTSTPKVGWAHTDVVRPLRRAFDNIPIGFDTDTNGAALGEFFWGRAKALEDFVYITMGTGIGVGGMARGHLLHGLIHPEVGHIYLPRLPGDEFEGACPYHGACWEGLCSGPAMVRRVGALPETLSPDHIAWKYEAQYTAYAIANIIFTLSPKRIIIGGSIRKAGLLGEDAFFRSVRQHVQNALNGYVISPFLIGEGIHDYIVPPLLGDDAGVCGAIALGQCASVASAVH